MSAPETWLGADGTPIACREKLKVLAENHAEAAQMLADMLEDAVLMGVDEAAIRSAMADMVAGLPSPRRRAA